MSIKIRRADLTDLRAMSLLWLDMVGEELGPEATPDVTIWCQQVTLFYLFKPKFVALVAQDGDEIVGFIMGETFIDALDGKIHGISQTIYVAPNYRNKRVGFLLYHTLAKIFVGDHAEVISFYCKPDKIRFWEKKGYRCLQTMMSRDARNLSKAFGIE